MGFIGTGSIRSYSSQLKLPDCQLAAVRVSSSNSGSLLVSIQAAFHPSWEAQITLSLDSTVSTPVIWALFFLCHFYHVLSFFLQLPSSILSFCMVFWLCGCMHLPLGESVIRPVADRGTGTISRTDWHSHYWEASSGSDVQVLSVFLWKTKSTCSQEPSSPNSILSHLNPPDTRKLFFKFGL
jgi:hypothetical protein